MKAISALIFVTWLSHGLCCDLTAYMDDSSTCSYLLSQSVQLNGYSQGVNVKAWSSSVSRHPVAGGCTKTISSSAGYGMKFKVTSSYIGYGSGVTVKIYSGLSTSSSDLLATYSSGSSSSSFYSYTTDGYLTIKLSNPSYSTNYNFNILVRNYDYSSYDYYVPVGNIVGYVIGSIVFIVLVSVIGCCVRRRRRRLIANATVVTTPGAVTSVTTSTNINYPTGQAPYPTGQAPYPTGPVQYPPKAAA